jgi:hypothetical protein
LENALAYGEIQELKGQLEQEKLYRQDEVRSELNFNEIIGKSVALRRVLSIEQRYSDCILSKSIETNAAGDDRPGGLPEAEAAAGYRLAINKRMLRSHVVTWCRFEFGNACVGHGTWSRTSNVLVASTRASKTMFLLA